MKMETTDRSDFFGESKEDPGSFEFSIGERVLIHSISNHVKQIISKTDSTISHFYSRGGGNYEDAADLLWYSEANGYFFTNTREAVTNKTSQLDKDSLKNKLLKQTQGKIAEILQSPDEMGRFKRESIKITTANQTVRATVLCPLCDDKNEISISAKSSRGQ